MERVIRPARIMFSTICLAAVLFAGCREQIDAPGTPAGSVQPAQAVQSTQPLDQSTTPSELPPGHPAIQPGQEVAGQPANHPTPQPSPDLKAMPRVTLTEINIQEGEDGAVTRIIVAADGKFASNVLRKEDPARLILVIHNAVAGDLVGKLEVNNGMVGVVEVAQLETGQSPAVRASIDLTGPSEFLVQPAEDALNIDIRRQSQKKL